MNRKEDIAVNRGKKENMKAKIYELLLNTKGAMNLHQIAYQLGSVTSELTVLTCVEELIGAGLLKMSVFPLNQKWGCSCWYELLRKAPSYMYAVREENQLN